MATRTGDPHLDALIERFLDQPIGGDRAHDISELIKAGKGSGTAGKTIRDLADPELAEQLCIAITAQFIHFLQSTDPERYAEAEGYASCMGSMADPDGLGYGDRTRSGAEGGHDVALVSGVDGQEFMIDFTASQYGYAELPLVQRELADGTIEREWKLAPQLDPMTQTPPRPPSAGERNAQDIAPR